MDRSFEREIIPMARAEGNYHFAKEMTVLSYVENHNCRHGSRSLECPCRW